MKSLTFAVFGALLITLTGCSATNFARSSTQVLTSPVQAISSIGREKPVGKILCLWEPAEGQGLDEKPTRGFAGQVMFFTHGDPSPIKVNGTVRVYEYANYDDTQADHEPIHTFTFVDGGWDAHRVEGTLGQTYNVFLPYVADNKRHAVCALRVEYESADGRKVSSPFTKVTLASKTSTQAASGLQRHAIKNQTIGRAKDVSIHDLETGVTQKKKRMESTTIQLPSLK